MNIYVWSSYVDRISDPQKNETIINNPDPKCPQNIG